MKYIIIRQEQWWSHLCMSMDRCKRWWIYLPSHTSCAKSRTVVEAAMWAAKVNFPPPKTATGLLRNSILAPSDDRDAAQQPSTSSGLPPRTPSPESLHIHRRAPASVPQFQKTSGTKSQPNTVPRRRNYQISDNFSSLRPTHGSISPSPIHVRSRSPSGPSSASMAVLTGLTTSPPFPTKDRNLQQFTDSKLTSILHFSDLCHYLLQGELCCLHVKTIEKEKVGKNW